MDISCAPVVLLALRSQARLDHPVFAARLERHNDPIRTMDAGGCEIMAEDHDRNAHLEHSQLGFEGMLETAHDHVGDLAHRI